MHTVEVPVRIDLGFRVLVLAAIRRLGNPYPHWRTMCGYESSAQKPQRRDNHDEREQTNDCCGLGVADYVHRDCAHGAATKKSAEAGAEPATDDAPYNLLASILPRHSFSARHLSRRPT